MVDSRHFVKVFHPTDFSAGSDVAFVHALKLALEARSKLEIVHVDRHPKEIPWSDFPGVRDTLTRWGVLPEGAPEDAFEELHIRVSKFKVDGTNPATVILDKFEFIPTNLIVLATHQRHGLDRWLHREIANRLSREAHAPALFVPHNTEGFVDNEDGKVSLNRILVPVAGSPDAAPIIELTFRLAAAYRCDSPKVTLVHVGDDPDIVERADPRGQCKQVTVDGDVVSRILELAGERHVDMIAMSTEGHHGFLDALRGNITEQVLRDAPCPVLALPVKTANG